MSALFLCSQLSSKNQSLTERHWWRRGGILAAAERFCETEQGFGDEVSSLCRVFPVEIALRGWLLAGAPGEGSSVSGDLRKAGSVREEGDEVGEVRRDLVRLRSDCAPGMGNN